MLMCQWNKKEKWPRKIFLHREGLLAEAAAALLVNKSFERIFTHNPSSLGR